MDLEKLKALIEESLVKNSDALKADVELKIKEAVEAKAKELGLDQVQKNFKKAEGEGEDEAKGKIAAFIKAVTFGDKLALKDMSEGTDSAGGYLVPTELYNGVMHIIGNYGIARKFGTTFNMKSDTLDVPTIATSVTTYWPGEGGAGTESQPVYGNAQLLAKTQVGLTVTSNELLEDAATDTVNNLMELFAEALAYGEDNQAFNGTGSPFTGILQDSDVNQVDMAGTKDTFAEMTLDNLRDMITPIKAVCLASSAYYMHGAVWAIVQKLTENSQHISSFQNPVVTMGGVKESGEGLTQVGTLWGYPVYLSDVMPSSTAVSTAFVAFGSLKKGLFIGDRKKMTLGVAKEAYVGGASMFERNQAAIRITERVAIKVGLPKALSVLVTAAS
jgi:HK97 family phage major capsid protein